MEQAQDVRIDQAAVERLAEALAGGSLARPAWRVAPHWWDDDQQERTATYVLLLDALNFSFWGEPRWRVAWGGVIYDGYWALAAALRRALDAGVPLYDPEYLATRADAAALLEGVGRTPIPLLRARQAAIREVGEGLLRRCGGSFLHCLAEADSSAARLILLVVERFPSFHDVASYQGREVPFFKRAQILVSDLWGAFEGAGPGRFDELEALTMFADYKVPQVLSGLGVLAYSDALRATLAAHELLGYGDRREVEIRAASVQAVERVRSAVEARGVPMRAFEVDWALWAFGQGRDWPLPYHRTRSVFY